MAIGSEPVRSKEFNDKFAEFVNSWPLYSPLEIPLKEPLTGVPELPPTILRDCQHCASTTTWYRRHPAENSSGRLDVGAGWVVRYACMHCRQEEIRIWLAVEVPRDKNPDESTGQITTMTLRKLGQWPAQHVEPSREVVKGLKKPVAEMFKKGLTSLAHGYGLGALAYFRRVVEEASTDMIDLFADNAAAEGDNKAAEAIRATKGQRMEDRLKLASEALPATLKPGGVNPLAVLYDHYSRGIHGLSDEECLEVARELYDVLEYIFRNWRTQMQDATRFRTTVRRWGSSGRTAVDKG
jgi:hypothetical protein